MARQPHRCGLVCLVSLVLLGCGPRLTPVTGKVTYRGQPLAGATVRLLPPHGTIVTGVTDGAGQFLLSTGQRPGAAAGRYKVCVTKFDPAWAENIKQLQGYPGGKLPAAPKSEIPARYANPNQSGLEALVTGNSAQDTFEFRLAD